jgi:hypothetical protein
MHIIYIPKKINRKYFGMNYYAAKELGLPFPYDEDPHVKHNPNGEGRKRELLDRLEKKTLGPDEAKELQAILQKELADARQRGDIATIVAILLLLGLIAGLIYAASKS